MPRMAAVQRSTAHVDSLPAPVGGWNARDAWANMAPTDAVGLTNLFPGVSSVNLRGGFSNWSTGLAGQIESLLVYNGGSVSQLFGVDANTLSIYNCTTQGAVAAPVVTSLTNARWEYTNIATAGGNFLMTVNGADDLQLYDGSVWKPINSGSSPAITGVDTDTLNNILLFKNRVWLLQNNTLVAWYLPTQSIAGVAQELDLSSVATLGGYLVDMAAWTIDAGYGADDMLVFVTSQGEIIVYRGTDPASDATWALVGVWQLGAPVGKRCMLKFGGDTLLISLDGLLPLASALQSSRLDPRVAISDKIQGALSAATSTYKNSFGWQVFYYPKANAVWINVPVQTNGQQQYVMNTITTSWCNFTGWNANCWALFNDEPYFGGNAVVCKAWDSTYADNATNINGLAFQAFNYFDLRGVEKYFTRARPIITTTGQPNIQVGMSIDFSISENVTPIPYSLTSPGSWDVGLWDVASWGQSLNQIANWQGITGIGYCGGPQFQTASQDVQINWSSTDVVFQTGWAGI